MIDLLRQLEQKKIKALFITVDSAVAGKRERDLRNKIAMQLKQQEQQQAAATGTKAPSDKETILIFLVVCRFHFLCLGGVSVPGGR